MNKNYKMKATPTGIVGYEKQNRMGMFHRAIAAIGTWIFNQVSNFTNKHEPYNSNKSELRQATIATFETKIERQSLQAKEPKQVLDEFQEINYATLTFSQAVKTHPSESEMPKKDIIYAQLSFGKQDTQKEATGKPQKPTVVPRKLLEDKAPTPKPRSDKPKEPAYMNTSNQKSGVKPTVPPKPSANTTFPSTKVNVRSVVEQFEKGKIEGRQ